VAEIEKYALVTVECGDGTAVDIKVDRNLSMKRIIKNLFLSLNKDTRIVHGFYVKARLSGKLLSQNDTLKEFDIYDGEILNIL